MPKLSIIIPCYFNEANIPVTAERLLAAEALYPEGTEVEYVMVDDGSRDQTFLELYQFHRRRPRQVRIVKLAGNVGSYSAILAGMHHAGGDCSAVISADLQDPPELLPRMYSLWLEGHKLVIANRAERNDGFFADSFSRLYHYFMRRFAIRNLPKGGFDVVLFDAQLRKEVVKMNEKNTNTLFLLPFMGFEPVYIPYARQKRDIGRSRWTLAKKVKLFVDSFTAFSYFPIRLISVMGLILGFAALLYAGALVALRVLGMIEVQGWTTLMVVILFVSSFQMIATGIVGEYVWRTLDAARNRPVFVVEKVIEPDSE